MGVESLWAVVARETPHSFLALLKLNFLSGAGPGAPPDPTPSQKGGKQMNSPNALLRERGRAAAHGV